MENDIVKCPTCKRKIHHLNKEGLFVTKNCSVLESNPRTGATYATCKFCKTRIELQNLKMISEEIEAEIPVLARAV